MKKKTFHICIGMLLAFTACQSESPIPLNEEERGIYLSAEVNGKDFSRTPYSQTTPTVEKPFHSSVWASTTDNTYQHIPYYGDMKIGETYPVAVHSEAIFRSGINQLLKDVIYPKDGADVYFVGLYPHLGWTSSASNNQANYTFTGKEDVMYAPEVSGNYSHTRVVTLHYYHLLTWLRLKIVAESQEVANAWGKIEGITIKSQNNLSIDLTMAATKKVGGNTVFDETCVTFSATEPEPYFPFYGKDSDTEYATDVTPKAIPYIPYDPDDKVVTNEKIKNHAEEVAYVLCAPVNATNLVDDGSGKGTMVPTNEYVITLHTTKRKNVTVNVDLKDEGGDSYNEWTMGKQFTVLLNFQLGNTIAVQTGLTGIDDWKHAGGIGEGHLGEQ